jgi:hypothetical protein
MFVHIGNGETVPQKEIIGLFDLDTVTVSAQGRDFLTRAEKENRVSYADANLPRSFLLTVDGKVRLSRISTLGLKTRMNTPLGSLEE